MIFHPQRLSISEVIFTYINNVRFAIPIVTFTPCQNYSVYTLQVTSSIMKLSAFVLMGLAAQQASAFPSYLSEAMIQIRNADRNSQIEEKRCPHAKREAEASAEAEPGCPYAKRQAPGITPPFDGQQQYVSNTGAHAFVAPGPNDQRGPCPGLNAMANHGYMPHSGVGQLTDFITGTAAVFGMGTSPLVYSS